MAIRKMNKGRTAGGEYLGLAGKPVEKLRYSNTGNMTAAVKKIFFLVDKPGKIRSYAFKVGTAPVGATLILDINKNGTSVFTAQGNRPIFADGGLVSSTTAPTTAQNTFIAGDVISIDCDQIGSGTAGADLSGYIEYAPT